MTFRRKKFQISVREKSLRKDDEKILSFKKLWKEQHNKKVTSWPSSTQADRIEQEFLQYDKRKIR